MSADSECATCGAKPGEACFYQYPSDLHDRGSITAAAVDAAGIATGLSRALVALEGRARELALRLLDTAPAPAVKSKRKARP